MVRTITVLVQRDAWVVFQKYFQIYCHFYGPVHKIKLSNVVEIVNERPVKYKK